MRTVVMLPSEAECEIVVKDTQGKPIKVGSIEITPMFYNPKAAPAVLFFETRLDDYLEEDEAGEQSEVRGQLLQRGMVVLSGATGMLRVSDRTTSVKSQFETKLEAEAEAAVDDSEDETQVTDEGEEEAPVIRRRKKGAR